MWGLTVPCAVPTWGIIIIVVVSLLVLLCIGVLVRKLLSKKRHKSKDAKKGTKGPMDVKGVPMLGALTTKVPPRSTFILHQLISSHLSGTELNRTELDRICSSV